MCGVTRASFNSNRSSCGIEVVAPFSACPAFEHAEMYSVQFRELTACRLAGHRVIEDARSQVTRRRGGHNRQELTHAAFKATEATAPEATEAATTTASGIAGTPSRVSSSAPILRRGWHCI